MNKEEWVEEFPEVKHKDAVSLNMRWYELGPEPSLFIIPGKSKLFSTKGNSGCRDMVISGALAVPSARNDSGVSGLTTTCKRKCHRKKLNTICFNLLVSNRSMNLNPLPLVQELLLDR